MNFREAIGDALARRLVIRMVEPRNLDPEPGVVFVDDKGPHMRRARGERGYRFGHGPMALPGRRPSC